MIKVDENALICDLAETYHIFNYKEIAADKVAIFAIGLRDDSRIKMKISGSKLDFKTLLLAKLVDDFAMLLWSKTKESRKGLNKPYQIIGSLFKKESDVKAFQSGKDFELEKQRLLAERSDNHGN